MRNLFPLVTEISKIRGTVGIIKQNKGAMGISELAEEVDEDIDDLLPLIEALKILGFAVVKDSTIKLTPEGRKLTFGNSQKMVRQRLSGVEPFKSTIEILKLRDVETEELFEILRGKGIVVHGEKETNDLLMKKMLLRLGVRAKLMSYDAEKDTWSVERS